MSESTGQEQRPFSYSGQLIFNEIYAANSREISNTSSQNNGEFRDELRKLLSGSSSPDDSTTQIGYQNHKLTEQLDEYDINGDDSKLSDVHVDIASETATKKFIHEEYGPTTQILDEKNNRHKGTQIYERTAYIYWTIPDLVFIQGSKKNAHQAYSDLTRRLSQSQANQGTVLERIEFDPHFLLWIIYQVHNSGKIDAGFEIESIEDVMVQGEREFFGETIRVSGSTNVLRSTPFIEGLLKGQLPVQIKVSVKAGGQSLLVDISEEGRIHILADKSARDADKLERALLALHFVREFTRFRRSWRWLDPQDKFVPPSFAPDLYDIAKEEDVTIDFRKELVQTLLNERNESLDDWDIVFD